MRIFFLCGLLPLWAAPLNFNPVVQNPAAISADAETSTDSLPTRDSMTSNAPEVSSVKYITPQVFIRGIANAAADSSRKPLIIVDGVIWADERLPELSPSDIENITLLKYTDSTFNFPCNPRNGAILITTKEGIKNTVDSLLPRPCSDIASPLLKPAVRQHLGAILNGRKYMHDAAADSVLQLKPDQLSGLHVFKDSMLVRKLFPADTTIHFVIKVETH